MKCSFLVAVMLVVLAACAVEGPSLEEIRQDPKRAYASTPDSFEVNPTRNKRASMTFPVFDATRLNHPELRPGMVPMSHIGAPQIHTDFSVASNTTDLPDMDLLKSKAAGIKDDYAFVDIEHLSLHPDSPDYEASVNYHKYVLTTVRALRPDVKWGSYGTMPRREYWKVQENRKIGKPEEYFDWIKENDARLGISEYTDMTLPSLYTFNEDIDGWETYAIEQILQAKRTGKPVYPFLWFEFHPNGGLNPTGTLIPGDYWRRQLEICKAYADGVVIWGISTTKEFDPTWPWWQETVDFMSSLPVDAPVDGPTAPPAPPAPLESIWFGSDIGSVNKYVLQTLP